MRGLTSKQKRILTEWVNKHKDLISYSFDVQEASFPYELYALLESINNFETLNQEINRFVRDSVQEE